MFHFNAHTHTHEHTQYNKSLFVSTFNVKILSSFDWRSSIFFFAPSLQHIDLSQEIDKGSQDFFRFVHFYSAWLWAKHFHRNLWIKLLTGWQSSERNWIEHIALRCGEKALTQSFSILCKWNELDRIKDDRFFFLFLLNYEHGLNCHYRNRKTIYLFVLYYFFNW